MCSIPTENFKLISLLLKILYNVSNAEARLYKYKKHPSIICALFHSRYISILLHCSWKFYEILQLLMYVITETPYIYLLIVRNYLKYSSDAGAFDISFLKIWIIVCNERSKFGIQDVCINVKTFIRTNCQEKRLIWFASWIFDVKNRFHSVRPVAE